MLLAAARKNDLLLFGAFIVNESCCKLLKNGFTRLVFIIQCHK